jgi:DeoR/GlpR family transcriptional regulator of sugar metabolism
MIWRVDAQICRLPRIRNVSQPDNLPDERQRFIIDRLARDGRVLASDLARELATSEDTIRRDLRELAAAGLCRRVYGGALPVSPASNSFAERAIEAPGRKAALGKAAASLIESRQVVFLDAGSTNLAIAQALPFGLGLTVATNAPFIAAAFNGRTDIELIMLGGRVDTRSGAVIGARAVRDALAIRPDLTFLGACAIDAKAGAAAFDAEEAEFKRALVDSARAIAIAATNEKLGTTAPFAVLAAAALHHLIVEAEAPAGKVADFKSLNINVLRASRTGANP